MSDLRLAVVGAGIMGSNHIRVAQTHRRATLAAVVDDDIERAVAASGTSGATPLARVDELDGLADAVILAAPTAFHVPLGERLLEMGMHLLVEKPIASTSAEAARLVAAAGAAGRVLMVGHIERFNPAVAQLPDYVDEPLHIEASRINPYTKRISDGVILDLMIHDIDIVLSLLPDGATVTEMGGVMRQVRGTTEDLAIVTMRFSNDVTAVFNTSRLGQNKVRTIEVTQAESQITADLLRQSLEIHRMSHHEYVGAEGARYRQTSVVEIPFIDGRGEPLFHEQRDFIECVLDGRTPRVDGAAGARALRLAEEAARALAGQQ